MAHYIVLLRGINVGGHGKLPMAQLRTVLAELGATGVQTYIQSGNVVMQHAETSVSKLEARIAKAVEQAADFEPKILVRKRADFRKEVAANPFPKAEGEMDGKALHCFFLAKKPKALDKAEWDASKNRTENYALVGRVLYLHTPGGLTPSKLAPKVERRLGVAATARNWRTVQKLLEMSAD